MVKDQVALVTGGSRGLGRAIALKLAENGANVAIFYAGNAEKAAATVADVEALGVKARAYQVNVADYAAVEEAVKAVKADFGGVDILVNNAGITRDKLTMRMSAEDFDDVLSVNLNGAFHTIRALYSDFVRRRSGRIINVTSVSGLMGNPGQANYAASKAGMVGLTKTIAKELAGRGITCNAIAPGFIETDMTAAMNENTLNKALEMVPMKRMGRPEDVANAALFLASDSAAYITGCVLQVDGGLYM
ncbi:MAG: 3-oxoacyl-[acyl-carrier-protein] reductase [Clostridia bacterium]|nr:3-oxoacyl-[acyl-carrier-protein] reductase [Clostridia bacterium]